MGDKRSKNIIDYLRSIDARIKSLVLLNVIGLLDLVFLKELSHSLVRVSSLIKGNLQHLVLFHRF